MKTDSSLKPHLTRAQKQVHHLLEQAEETLTAQTIHQRLQDQAKAVGRATVYRAVRSLQVKGIVQARALPNGEWAYGLAANHSHYLTCLNCGTSVLIEHCPVQSLAEKLSQKSGQSSEFQIFYHTLEFFGLCAPCTGHLDTENP